MRAQLFMKLNRVAALTTRVQRRWRGVAVRRRMEVFARERRRLREVRNAMAFRIQRVYRGWWGRKAAPLRTAALWSAATQAIYAAERGAAVLALSEAAERGSLLQAYKAERSAEAAARCLGLIDAQAYGGSSMRAFAASVYCDGAAAQAVSARVKTLAAQERAAAATAEVQRSRELFVTRLCAQDPAFRRYFAAERRGDNNSASSSATIAGAVTVRSAVASRTKGAPGCACTKLAAVKGKAATRALLQNRAGSYVYRAGINDDPLACLKEQSGRGSFSGYTAAAGAAVAIRQHGSSNTS
jgi:hypothetical protein